MGRIKKKISWHQIWYENHPLSLLLIPFSWLFCLVSLLRRQAYSSGFLHRNKLTVPVIIVGNISVGGTGKTPLVIWLVKFLKKQGLKPGVISRGYGGQSEEWPQNVDSDSNPLLVGDEAVVIAKNTDCPVVVAPNRFEAGKLLLDQNDCDIIVSDDGLQHYSLHRDFEICVIDGERRHGNGRCLPAGPLRERQSRLKSVDVIVCNGVEVPGEFYMAFEASQIKQVNGSESRSFREFRAKNLHAVAGTGNPGRFFETLRKLDLNIIEHPFEDHYNFKATDFEFGDNAEVIMTEKDAVKCRDFANNNHWYLPIEATLPKIFEQRLINMLKNRRKE